MTQQSLAKLKSLTFGSHASLVFRDREEQMAVTIPFILIGLERSERCVYLADPLTVEIVKERLKAAGADVDRLTQGGALALSSARDHLEHGVFDPDKMIQFLETALIDALKSGFAGLRATGDIIWELGTDLDLRKLFKYEAMLDRFFPDKKLVGLCQYPLKIVPPQYIRHSLYTHPFVVHDRKLCSNEFYDPSHAFQDLESEISEYHAVSNMCRRLLAGAV